MKEKVHEYYTKAAKTPLMIYYAEQNATILWIRPWHYEHPQSVNDFGSCILANQRRDWLPPFINEVFATFIVKE
jgi:hypothetical protein